MLCRPYPRSRRSQRATTSRQVLARSKSEAFRIINARTFCDSLRRPNTAVTNTRPQVDGLREVVPKSQEPAHTRPLARHTRPQKQPRPTRAAPRYHRQECARPSLGRDAASNERKLLMADKSAALSAHESPSRSRQAALIGGQRLPARSRLGPKPLLGRRVCQENIRN